VPSRRHRHTGHCVSRMSNRWGGQRPFDRWATRRSVPPRRADAAVLPSHRRQGVAGMIHSADRNRDPRSQVGDTAWGGPGTTTPAQPPCYACPSRRPRCGGTRASGCVATGYRCGMAPNPRLPLHSATTRPRSGDPVRVSSGRTNGVTALDRDVGVAEPWPKDRPCRADSPRSAGVLPGAADGRLCHCGRGSGEQGADRPCTDGSPRTAAGRSDVARHSSHGRPAVRGRRSVRGGDPIPSDNAPPTGRAARRRSRTVPH
jgi:hypothetical protein